MLRTALVTFAALTLSAAAAAAGSAPVAATEAAAAAASTPPVVSGAVVAKKNDKVCRMVEITGTRQKRKVCQTAAEWNEDARD
jgi:hypothetical protein